MIGPAAPDEEGVAEPVQILDSFGGDVLFAGESDGDAFGTAADGAAGVEFRVQARAAGEDEGAERGEVRVGVIDFFFELGDFGGSDAGLFGMDVLRFGGEDGAEVEELVLDAAEDGGELGQFFGGGDAGHADEGVELVDGAVAFDAEGVLGDALAAGEMGFAFVAHFGVDAVEGDAGLVELGVGHRAVTIVIHVAFRRAAGLADLSHGPSSLSRIRL